MNTGYLFNFLYPVSKLFQQCFVVFSAWKLQIQPSWMNFFLAPMLDYSLLISRNAPVLAYWFHMVQFCWICLLDLVSFFLVFYTCDHDIYEQKYFYSSFKIIFIYSSYQITLSKISSMLNISGKCGHSCCS